MFFFANIYAPLLGRVLVSLSGKANKDDSAWLTLSLNLKVS